MHSAITSTITIIRAVAVEYARRIIQPLLIGAAVAAVVIHAFGIWLVTMNEWWWLLEALFIAMTILGLAVSTGILILLRRVRPPMTRQQRRSVSAFVDKLERVAEHLQTPQPVLIFRVVRDALRPGTTSFIGEVIHDSGTLGPDFKHLKDDLSNPR